MHLKEIYPTLPANSGYLDFFMKAFLRLLTLSSIFLVSLQSVGQGPPPNGGPMGWCYSYAMSANPKWICWCVMDTWTGGIDDRGFAITMCNIRYAAHLDENLMCVDYHNYTAQCELDFTCPPCYGGPLPPK